MSGESAVVTQQHIKRIARLRQMQALKDLETLATENSPDRISSLNVGVPMSMVFIYTIFNLVFCLLLQ